MSVVRREVTGKKPGGTKAGGGKTPLARGPPQLLAYSIEQFCALHGISVDFYFKLQRKGLGPKVMRVGARTLISIEAGAAWRREREEGAPPAPVSPQGRGRSGKVPPKAEEAVTTL
jgi:hypothetical protein